MIHSQTPVSRLVRAASDTTQTLKERRQAFDSLVARFQDMAFGCAYALLGDATLAEDTAQEAFVSAWHHLGQLQDADAFPGWFKRIVVTCSRRQAERNRSAGTIPLAAADTLVMPIQTAPHVHLLQREERARVRAAVADLPQAERLVVILFYVGNYSRQEVAAFLGVSSVVVKKRLASARARLHERLLTSMQEELQDIRPSNTPDFSQRVSGFTTLFSALVDSGQPLLLSLDQLAEQEEDPSFRDVITQVRHALAAGSCLSQALQPYPHYFSPRYLAVIREGEVSGELDVALHRLAQ